MHAILVHGYFSSPKKHWFQWLIRELEGRGWTVEAPYMPHPTVPTREAWVEALLPLLRSADPAETVLVGHSLGCIALIYALEVLRPTRPFAKAVLCGGFGRNFEGDPDPLATWFEMDPDLQTVRSSVTAWTCVHSTDDDVVPFEEAEWLAGQLGAKLVTLEGKGHLTTSEGVTELPSALEAILA